MTDKLGKLLEAHSDRFSFTRDEETGWCLLNDERTRACIDLGVQSYEDGLWDAEQEIAGILASEVRS
jgi:hypothetical protein